MRKIIHALKISREGEISKSAFKLNFRGQLIRLRAHGLIFKRFDCKIFQKALRYVYLNENQHKPRLLTKTETLCNDKFYN